MVKTHGAALRNRTLVATLSRFDGVLILPELEYVNFDQIINLQTMHAIVMLFLLDLVSYYHTLYILFVIAVLLAHPRQVCRLLLLGQEL